MLLNQSSLPVNFLSLTCRIVYPVGIGWDQVMRWGIIEITHGPGDGR
jgi:hypothetical protein